MNKQIFLFSVILLLSPSLWASQAPRSPTVQGTIGYYLEDMNRLLQRQEESSENPDKELSEKYTKTKTIIGKLGIYIREQMPHPYHQSDAIPEPIMADVRKKICEIPSVILAGSIWTDQYKKWIEEAIDRKFLFDREKLLDERKCTKSKFDKVR